jgi:ABC-type transporter Mla maintaining outer membrane lipid asymmetry permease subunit MlaE
MVQKLAYRIGARAFRAVDYFRGLFNLFTEASSSVFRYWKKNRIITKQNVIMQILFTGVEAVPLVSMMGLMIGSIVIIQSTTLAPKFGAGEFLGKIMVIGVIRELGPLVTAFIVIGRSGAALSTYLGNMKVANELDALEVMGIDPVHVRVMPALLGFIISLAGLTLFFDAVAIIGGFAFSRLLVSLPLSGTVDHRHRHQRYKVPHVRIHHFHRQLLPCHEHRLFLPGGPAGHHPGGGEFHRDIGLVQHDCDGYHLCKYCLRLKTGKSPLRTCRSPTATT